MFFYGEEGNATYIPQPAGPFSDDSSTDTSGFLSDTHVSEVLHHVLKAPVSLSACSIKVL